MNIKDEAALEKEILEEIKKVTSRSLQKKLIYIGHLDKQREDFEENGFNQEYPLIKTKYEALYSEVYNEIDKIVKGEALPNLTPEENLKYTIQDVPEALENGIPLYWSTALNNAKFFTVNDKDSEILKHLITVRLKNVNDTGFTAEFEFSSANNEFFSDSVLTKTYVYNSKTDELTKTVGCQIHWASPEKNPRIKKQVKNIKKGKKSEKKTIEKIVPSFFDIFADQEGDDIGMANEEAKFIKEDLLPNSLEYYLDILAFEEEDIDEEGEHDEDEDVAEPAHAKKKTQKGKKASSKAESKEKCKNQ